MNAVELPYLEASRFASDDAIDLATWTMHKMHASGFDAHLEKLRAALADPLERKNIGSIRASIAVTESAKATYGSYVLRRNDLPSAERIEQLEQLDRDSRPDTWAKLLCLVEQEQEQEHVSLADVDFGRPVSDEIRALIESVL